VASRSGGVGKSIVLLILIIILTLLGLLWFDFLGVIHAKKYFSPLYKLMGLSPQTSVSGTAEFPIVADLDEDRLAVRLEALDARTEELNQREAEVKRLESENQQIAQELEDRRISQDEREKTFNNTLKQHDDRDKNIAQISANLNGMNPEAAVNILLAMDDQDVIDVLRKTEEDAQASGKSSMVAYWLSLMPSERAAKISEKSANKPISLD
jgi:flagellar protein FlbB